MNTEREIRCVCDNCYEEFRSIEFARLHKRMHPDHHLAAGSRPGAAGPRPGAVAQYVIQEEP